MDEQPLKKNEAPWEGASKGRDGCDAGPESFEVAAGGWEAFWVIVFYASIVVVLLATFKAIPWSASLAGIAAVFLSILAVASSYRRLQAEENGLALEVTRFWMSRTRPLPSKAVRGLRVVESRRSRQWEKGEPPQRDLSYFVFVELLTEQGKIRVFRSSLTTPPGRNRTEAMQVAEVLSRLTGHPPEHILR